MPRSAALILCALLCAGLHPAASLRGYGADFIDIDVQAKNDHEIRYTSGKAIYVEALQEAPGLGSIGRPMDRSTFP